MTVYIDQSAPFWAQQMERQINQDVLQASLGPFMSRTPFTAASMPDATQNAWKLAFVSDGAGDKFVAVSNGVAWYYLEGTPV